MAKSSAPGYHCTECGWTTVKWVGRCGECQTWGSVVEVSERTGIRSRVHAIAPNEHSRARPITEIDETDVGHVPSGISELDRVLGGGIVPGAAILLSGEPGVGKSTLLLEVASRAAHAGRKTLYVSAEESVAQVRLRASRTGALSDNLYLAAETDLGSILGQIDELTPELLIVDSVQTVSSDSVDGIAGQPSQVREVASALIRVAKEKALPVLLVGHVTKDGTIAGPRVLEHLVDVVCQFEGDRHTALRFLRTLKNRFGPTDEVGCWEMTGGGIREVSDPSGLFLSRAQNPVSGTCVTVTLEGRRVIPVEIQALVVPTKNPQPRRVVNGVDPARVAMIVAVLEKRARMKGLGENDIYVSTVGGVRLSEPGADLAIAIAVGSALTDTVVPHTLAAFGEISLAGEVRPVAAREQRSLEAQRLGYRTLIDSEVGSVRAALDRVRLAEN